MKNLLILICLVTLTSCSINITSSANTTSNTEIISPNIKANLAHLEYLNNDTDIFSLDKSVNHSIPTANTELELDKYNSYYVLPNSENYIYLTFDCTDDYAYTSQILDILKRHNIKACFFVPGTFIDNSPKLTKRIINDGHIIGNHTLTHSPLTDRPLTEVEKELSYNNKKLFDLTGRSFDPFVRFPKGSYSEQTLSLSNDLGYNTVFWSLYPKHKDFKNPTSSDDLNEYIYKNIHSGAIIRFNTSLDTLPDSLDDMISELENKGYIFNTFNNLF